MEFPGTAADVSAAWLADRLRASGALRRGKIESLRWEPFGTGQMGTNARFHLRYDTEDAGPATLIGKFASADEASRQTAAAFDVYTREVCFYRELHPLLDVRAPACHAAEVDATGSRFVLLLEDLGPARVGSQLEGCSLDDARAAMRQAAAFHAKTRNNPAITGLAWLAMRAQSAGQLVTVYPEAQRIFRERFAGIFPADLMAVADRFAAAAARWWGREKPNPGLAHGDFRLDNMLFDIKGGTEPIAIVDWAALLPESGLTDIGYFLGCGVGSDFRRAHEEELLDLYCEEMSRRGVPLCVTDIWDEYRIGALHGLATAVFSTAFVQRTERGDESLLSMALGAASLAQDHGSLEALLR